MNASLSASVERFAAGVSPGQEREARGVAREFLAALEAGEVRAASPEGGRWRVNAWVKQGVLLAFRVGVIEELPAAGPLTFTDKDTLPPRAARSLGEGVRLVPGGSAVRAGAHLERGVTLMPPCYVNVGAWIGEGTMVDSHALVGSCAQVGARVHLSAAAQVGGVLEPIGTLPVVVEDDVVVGGNCGLYEGVLVRRRAVLGAGVILTRSTPVFDLVRGLVLRADADGVLEIPEGAVVVPGARPAEGDFARAHGLSIVTPVIVKYRDARTDARTALEEALRS